MKNKSPKANSQKKKSNAKNKDLNDLGLEPPKIYRDSSSAGRLNQAQSKKSSGNNLTRNEKRQKQTKKRKKRNTLRKILVWIVVLLTFVAVGVILSLTVFFSITEVTITGNKLYKSDEILSKCTIDAGENLFLADTDTAKEMLEQNLPYIYSADITRKLPGIINIEITEAEPAYSIKNEDKTYVLLDDNFKVLETNSEKAQGIRISNTDIKTLSLGQKIVFNDDKIDECLNELAACIKSNSFDGITSIYSKGLADNYVGYDSRIKFKLGTCDNLDTKIYKGLTACEKLNETNPNAKGTMVISGDKSIYFTED